MSKKTTIQEMKALLYIKQQLSQGKSPTVRSISAHLGYRSPQSGSRMLDALEEKGYISRNSAGKLELKKLNSFPKGKVERSIQVPIVGYVTCGSPIQREENVTGYLRVTESTLSAGKDHFILQAMGDSMDQAGINDGDYLLIAKDAYIRNNDIVLAFIDDDATVKRYKENPRGFMLIPESSNPEHTPIFSNQETIIIGKVIEVIPNWK